MSTAEIAELPAGPDDCPCGWHDGKSGHVCGLPAKHNHKCKCRYCGAVRGDAPKSSGVNWGQPPYSGNDARNR